MSSFCPRQQWAWHDTVIPTAHRGAQDIHAPLATTITRGSFFRCWGGRSPKDGGLLPRVSLLMWNISEGVHQASTASWAGCKWGLWGCSRLLSPPTYSVLFSFSPRQRLLCPAWDDGKEKNPDLTHSGPKESAGEFTGWNSGWGKAFLAGDTAWAKARPFEDLQGHES